MSEFVAVAKVSEFPESGTLCVEHDEYYVVVVRLDDTFYCIDDVCTHDGGPLGDGQLDGNCLVCPRHGAKFDVRTGEAVLMPATEATVKHDVKVDGDSILVKFSGS